MTENIHPIQKKLLKLLLKNADDPLTIREMQEQVGVSSPSVITHHLTQLEKKRLSQKKSENPRDYQILEQQEKEITYINLYGLATCGQGGSLLDGNPIDKIAISTKLLSFPSSKAFMVKAKGDSMEPKINNGDLVIAKKSNDADNGEIVVCVNDGKSMVKKFSRGNGGVILTSLNSKHPPFLASTDDFRIEGVVKGVISNKLMF